MAVKLVKGSQEVTLGGFKDRDNVPGLSGSALRVTFTGLTPGSAESGAGYSLVFTTFYQGYILTFSTNATVILPSVIALAPPASPAESNPGPWMVHERIRPFTVNLLSASGSLSSSITKQDGVRVTARLINKGGLGDLSAQRLVGNTKVVAEGGYAKFTNLSVVGLSGAGYSLLFYLEGSEKLCGPTTLYTVCQSWTQKRGASGGAQGGYHAEVIRANVTIVPDKIKAVKQGNVAVVRVDQTLSPYEVTLSDSKAGAISTIASSDGFYITARLYDALGVEVSMYLSGTSQRALTSDKVTFDDLMIIGMAGSSLQLVFEPSWRAQCVSQLRCITPPQSLSGV